MDHWPPLSAQAAALQRAGSTADPSTRREPACKIMPACHWHSNMPHASMCDSKAIGRLKATVSLIYNSPFRGPSGNKLRHHVRVKAGEEAGGVFLILRGANWVTSRYDPFESIIRYGEPACLQNKSLTDTFTHVMWEQAYACGRRVRALESIYTPLLHV